MRRHRAYNAYKNIRETDGILAGQCTCEWRNCRHLSRTGNNSITYWSFKKNITYDVAVCYRSTSHGSGSTNTSASAWKPTLIFHVACLPTRSSSCGAKENIRRKEKTRWNSCFFICIYHFDIPETTTNIAHNPLGSLSLSLTISLSLNKGKEKEKKQRRIPEGGRDGSADSSNSPDGHAHHTSCHTALAQHSPTTPAKHGT